MDLELEGKVAIVGGASKGLGRACAQVLADEGATVAVCNILASTVYQPIPNLALSGAMRMGVVAFAKSLAGDGASQRSRDLC